MKRILLPLLAVLFLAACAKATPPPTDEPAPAAQATMPPAAPASTTKTVYVGPELVDCVGVAPQKCMQVKTEPNAEYTLFYGQIQGFEFEPGFEYVLTVEETPVQNPPADAPDFTWTLVSVDNKTPVATVDLGDLWQLDWYMGSDGQQVSVLPGTQITLKYLEGTVSGNSGCNQYHGPAKIEGNQVKIGPLVSTMMACTEPVMAQEQAYLQALQSSVTFQAAESTLTLADASGATLLSYSALQPLALQNTLWQLTAYNNGKQAVVSVLAGSTVTAIFGEDLQVTGSAGCNNYFASYELNGDQISIGQAGSTMMFCDQPAGVMEQETAYLAALQSVASYKIEGDKLTFSNSTGGTALNYVAVKPVPLTGTLWDLTGYNNGTGGFVSVLAGTSVTAILGEEGALSGSAGCNQYNASYTIDGEQITIGAAASTRMFCGEPAGVMEQESAYLAALPKAASYHIQADVLTLIDAQGARVAEYKANPLVGRKWLLLEIAYMNDTKKTADNPANYSVLFNTDGNVSITADCNTGSATYSLQGSSLGIGPIAMTRAACPPESLSDEFVQNLQIAASYLIENERLYIATQMDVAIMEFVQAGN